MRLTANLVALGSVLAGRTMIACGLRRAPEGWRRTVGLLLRSEPTRFALSAFGVRIPGADRVFPDPSAVERVAAGELRAYLATQPDAHFQLEWHDVVTIRHRRDRVDLVVLRFSTDGTLTCLEPHLAEGGERIGDEALRAQVHRAVVDAFNETRHRPEFERPNALAGVVDTACRRMAAGEDRCAAYARRLLSAACLSFERVDLTNPAQRFCPPAFHARRTLGFGYLSIVMRVAADARTADVWTSAHHVGLDGVPLQDLVTGLERAWGRGETVVFPPADLDRPFMAPRTCSVDGERSVHEMLVFADFTPVFQLRETLNARYAADVGGAITFSTVLAWLIDREPATAGVRIASTVDVPASGGYERDVDVVPLRPADFANGHGPWAGFVEFAREFNRLIALSRVRRSPLRQQMQTAGLLPAWVHSQAVRSDPASLDTTFGTLCVTIIRDAKVFVAPMTDLGLGHGFFAIGNTSLPAADGTRVASVSIKGDAGAIAGHPAILKRVIARAAELHANLID